MLFDIDGVIRDVSGSYRRALVETVHHYSGWRPDAACVDALKGEGRWNNDWDASLELVRRNGSPVPERDALVEVFSGFYFGGDPEGEPSQWQGFIGSEPLLVEANFFAQLTSKGCQWGFVSGAEPPSARYVLQQRLGLKQPALIAMGDAPDKPDPSGLINLSDQLRQTASAAVLYLGDTVADVQTVLNARRRRPEQTWLSLAVAPPHLHREPQARRAYEQQLLQAGADHILPSTADLLFFLDQLTIPQH